MKFAYQKLIIYDGILTKPLIQSLTCRTTTLFLVGIMGK